MSRFPLADEYFESLRTTGKHTPQNLIEKTRSLQERLSQEFEQLNQTDNYRKEFIGDISHELKTPIFSIQGYLETLSAGALDDPAVNRNFLYKALKNVERLTLLTNDLMEISKLESGELQPNFQVIPLFTIIKDVVDTLQYKAEQNEISLETTSEENNMFAYADRNQIRQVLTNLIDNAIKYNVKKGKVSVSCIYSNNRKSIQIQIRDTGIGIPVEDIERVTERFFRVDKSRSRDQGGTGLGLSIVKHILEQHQQHLYISSNPGKGSTFLFHLKTARPNKD
ncbi:ATP-binding protein [Balneolaceae bacterium ANBcel3]|nr:ATP-binding protein [Balneolaceae bacterium ANBcel3]